MLRKYKDSFVNTDWVAFGIAVLAAIGVFTVFAGSVYLSEYLFGDDRGFVLPFSILMAFFVLCILYSIRDDYKKAKRECQSKGKSNDQI
jgi:hypothetical protein